MSNLPVLNSVSTKQKKSVDMSLARPRLPKIKKKCSSTFDEVLKEHIQGKIRNYGLKIVPIAKDGVSPLSKTRENKITKEEPFGNAEFNDNIENIGTNVKCKVERQNTEEFGIDGLYQDSVDVRAWISSCHTPKLRRRYSEDSSVNNTPNSSLDDVENIEQTLIKGAKALDMHRQREKGNKIIISDLEISIKTPFTRIKREKMQIKQNGTEKQNIFPPTRTISTHTNSLTNNVGKSENNLTGPSDTTISFTTGKKLLDEKPCSSNFDNGSMRRKFPNDSGRGVVPGSIHTRPVIRRKISDYSLRPSTPRPSLLSKRGESTLSLSPSYSLITHLEEELGRTISRK